MFKDFSNSSETETVDTRAKNRRFQRVIKEKLKVLTDEFFFKYFVIYHKSDSDSESSSLFEFDKRRERKRKTHKKTILIWKVTMHRNIMIICIFLINLVVASSSDNEECSSSAIESMYEAKGHHLLVERVRATSKAERRGGDETDSKRYSDRCGMEMLSIHSHKLKPQGVSVVTVLKESHLSIHTWPEHGTALADLFTCGNTNVSDVATRFINLLDGSTEKSSVSIVRRGIW